MVSKREGHLKQCTYIRPDGTRCLAWALHDAVRCRFHGGRAQQKAFRAGPARIDHLPAFYRDVLGPNLRDALDSLTGGSAAEQLSLFEELALMRVTARDAVKLYGKACSVVDKSKGLALRAEAAGIMQAQLREVAKLAEAAARIDSLAKDKFSIHAVHLLVNQLVRICASVFKGHDDLVAEFARRVKTDVKLPTSESQGTVLTPDQDVRDMDASVPFNLLEEEESCIDG